MSTCPAPRAPHASTLLTLAPALFALWDRALTPRTIARRVAEVAEWVALATGEEQIERAIAREATRSGETLCPTTKERIRDRLLQRHSRRRAELSAVLASPASRPLVGDLRHDLLALVGHHRRTFSRAAAAE